MENKKFRCIKRLHPIIEIGEVHTFQDEGYPLNNGVHYVSMRAENVSGGKIYFFTDPKYPGVYLFKDFFRPYFVYGK